MDYDCILKVIGRKSSFFLLVLCALSSVMYISSVQRHVLSVSLFQPSYQCHLPESVLTARDKNNVSAYISFNECQYRLNKADTFKPCLQYQFNKENMVETFITEYNLVCGRRYITKVMYYLQLLNIPLILLFGWLADYFGRKNCLIVLSGLHLMGHICIGLIDQLGIVVLLIVFNKLSVFTEFLGLIWLLELSDVGRSETVLCTYVILSLVSSISISMISYVVKQWRLVYLVSSLPAMCWLLIIFVPESPRWLLVTNRHKTFLQSVKTIAGVNRIYLSNDFLDEFLEETEWISPSRMSMGEFFSCFNLKCRLAMLSLLGFSMSVFPTQFTIDVLVLNPRDISIAYAYLSCINVMFLLPLVVNIFIKDASKCVKLLFTVILILYVISLFLNPKDQTEYVIRYILTIISMNLVHSSKILLIALCCYFMPTTHRSFSVACVLCFCLFGEIVSTAVKDIQLLCHYRTNFNIFVLVLCIISTLLVMVFHYYSPRLTRANYPQTPMDAELIERGNEDVLNEYQNDKQSIFEKSYSLSP